MPRKSAESTSIAKLSNVEVIIYPDPPYELSEAEGYVWNSVIRDCTPEWFSPRNMVLLKQYCRHVVSADHIAELINFYREDMSRAMHGQATIMDLKSTDYAGLLRMQATEGRMIALFAIKMRIAQQSTIDSVSANGRVKAKKPGLWELGS